MVQSSIYYYTEHKFTEYIKTITYKDIGIPEALDTFRERTVIPKRFTDMSISQLSSNNDKIRNLFMELRNRMAPESPRLRNGKQRERELIEELAQDYNIDTSAARARVVTIQYPSQSSQYRDQSTSQIFNFTLEVAIAPKKQIYGAEPHEVIAQVNGRVSKTIFDGGNYRWEEKDNEGYWRDRSASTISGILSECGFTKYGSSGWRKVPCIMFINLNSPCVEYVGSAGKTHINLVPYQDIIAEVVSKLANKMPSIRTNPGASQYWCGYSATEERGEYTKYLRNFLKERRNAVETDPSLITRDRLTQSGVWYRIRPKLIANGFVPKSGDWNTSRRGLTGAIAKTIRELWPHEKHVTREYLGIVAKARAFLYFRGQSYPVIFDSISELAKLGTTDMVVAEKEGITDVLLAHAAKFSIALVATAGKLVDYAKDLVATAQENGINVSTLYDDDLSGHEAPDVLKEMGLNIPRLGVDKSTVEWLRLNGYPNLKVDELIEEYTPETRNEWKYDEYLKTHRLELDSIVSAVGAEGLWKYIVHRIEEVFTETRDYRPVFDEPNPENYYPDEIIQLSDYLREFTEYAYSDKWNSIQKDELSKVKGLLQTEEKKESIDKDLQNTVDAHDGIKTIAAKIKELMDSGILPKIPDDDYVKIRQSKAETQKEMQQETLQSGLCENCKHNYVDDPEKDVLCSICKSDSKITDDFKKYSSAA